MDHVYNKPPLPYLQDVLLHPRQLVEEKGEISFENVAYDLGLTPSGLTYAQLYPLTNVFQPRQSYLRNTYLFIVLAAVLMIPTIYLIRYFLGTFYVTLAIMLASLLAGFIYYSQMLVKLVLKQTRILVCTASLYPRLYLPIFVVSHFLLPAYTCYYSVLTFLPIYMVIGLMFFRQPSFPHKRIIDSFRKLKPLPLGTSDQRGHPRSAKQREAARRTIAKFVHDIKLDQHDLSGNGGKSSRGLYFPADAKHGVKVDNRPVADHILTLIDVDYYIDLPRIIDRASEHGCKGVLCYTFIPSTLTGIDSEQEWSYSADVLTNTLNQGHTYQHQCWDYESDYVVVRGLFKDVILAVDKKHLGNDRYLVMLTIIGSYIDVPQGADLKRIDYRYGNFLYLEKNHNGIVNVSIAANAYPRDAITIPKMALVETLSRCKRKKGDSANVTYTGSIESVLRKFEENITPFQPVPYTAAMLALWLDNGFNHPALPNATFKIAPEYGQNDVTFEPVGDIVSQGKPTMQSAIPPVIQDLAFAPTNSINSEASMIADRVDAIRNHKHIGKKFKDYVSEFIRFVKPKRFLVPAEHKEIILKQSKPNQRLNSKRVEPFQTADLRKKAWSYFMKTESYEGANSPRPIANPSTEVKEIYSRYTYPLFDHVSKLPFFAFGKTPQAISDRVHELAKANDIILPTDFSKWDGTHSKDLALFELNLMKISYSKEYHEEITKMWNQHYNNKGYTTHGIEVDMQWGRPSGSPDTALFNTLCNALIAYVANRESDMDPKAAYAGLGLYGGDDGLSVKISPATYAKVCDEFGVKYTGDAQPADAPLTFLGRLYVKPKDYNHSVACPRRCLSKIHMVGYKKEAKQALADKIAGYLATDPDTPVLSDYLKAILVRHCKGVVPKPEGYWATIVESTATPFPQTAPHDLVLQAVSEDLLLELGEADSIITRLKKGEFPKLPASAIVVKRTSVLDGKVHHKV